MIVVDTNVVSELMRATCHPAVEAWFAEQAAASVFLTAISEAELRYDIAIMPAGKRREAVALEVEGMLTEDFSGRILPFDSDAAGAYAGIAAARRASGRVMSQPDCQIAAIALSRGARLATRNVRDFEGTGVPLTDPWGTA